jgi:hypothetical protein
MVPFLVLSWFSWFGLALFELRTSVIFAVIFVGYMLGSLFAHATLAAAWVVCGPGPVAWRIPLSLAWTISLPIAVEIHFAPPSGVVEVGGCLLGQWLAVQLALWGLVRGFGLQLRHRDDVEEGADVGQLRFGIRHLLLVMLITGVVMGIGRVVVSNISYSAGEDTVVFAFFAAAAILVTLPLLLAGLMRRLAAPGVVLALLLIAIVTACEPPIRVRLTSSTAPLISYWVLAINIGSAGLIMASALVVRLNGYCLYTRARNRLSR